MMRAALVLSIFAAIVLAVAAPASASDHATMDKAIEVLKIANPGVKIFRTTSDPVPRGMTGLSERAASATPETAARAFLDKYAAIFTLDTPGLSLDVRKSARTGFGHVVQFDVRYRGLAIVGGNFTVGIDTKGRIRSVASSLRAFSPIDVRPGINGSDALESALSVEGADTATLNRAIWKGISPLVVVPLTRGPALAYQVTVSRPADMSVWRVYVNASNGRVIYRRPLSVDLNQAKVYNPSPGYSMTDLPVTVTLTDFTDPTHATDKTLSNDRIFVQNCPGDSAAIEIFSYAGTTYTGPVCDWIFKLQADADGDFLADPLDPAECPVLSGSSVDKSPALRACFEKNFDDAFMDAMGYYHVNKIYDIFRSYGFDVLKTTPFMAAVNAKLPDFNDLFNPANCGSDDAGGKVCTTTRFLPFDNAAFTPYDPQSIYAIAFNIGQDAIIIGQGTRVDYGYDATVAYHEMTHAVIDTITSNGMIGGDEWGLVDEAGAINEGTADYYATTTTNDPKLGGYARRDTPGSALLEPDDCLRDLTVQVTCPNGMIGEVHNDGEVLSNALWSIRDLYKTTFSTVDTFKLDKAIYDTMPSWGEYPYFTEVSAYILQAFTDTPGIGADFAAAAQAKFEANSVTTCPRFQVMAPGDKKSMLFQEAGESGNPMPGYMQFAVDVPAEATKLMVSFNNNPQSQSEPYTKVMFRKGEHVLFTWDSDVAVYDFWVELDGDGYYMIQIPDLQPGNRYFLAFTNEGGTNVMTSMKFEISTEPVVIDGGTEDGGGTDGQTDDDGSVADGGEQDGQTAADGGAIDDAATVDGAVTPDGAVEDVGETDGGTPNPGSGCSCSTVRL